MALWVTTWVTSLCPCPQVPVSSPSLPKVALTLLTSKRGFSHDSPGYPTSPLCPASSVAVAVLIYPRLAVTSAWPPPSSSLILRAGLISSPRASCLCHAEPAVPSRLISRLWGFQSLGLYYLLLMTDVPAARHSQPLSPTLQPPRNTWLSDCFPGGSEDPAGQPCL